MHPLARRGDRQALRPGRAVAGGHGRDDHPRAGRRRRRGHPLELPGPDGGLEARAGARDRQQRRDQAGLDDVAEPAPDRGARRRGRHPRRRAQRRDRARATPSARRSAAIPTSTASRSPARPRSAGASSHYAAEIEPQARPARARRQEPAARLRRRRGPRPTSPRTSRSRSSGTWARTARPGRG